MSLKPYQEKIVQLMIDQEHLISKLYALFAEQFPELKDFWSDLSREEERHASLIEKLRDAEHKGLVFFDEGKTKTYTLTAFITHMEKMIRKAEDHGFTPVAALACAIDLEEALIEKNVFGRFDSLNEKARGVLGKVKAETRQHVEKVRRKRKEYLRRI